MIELNVKGMMCGGCAGTVEKAIKRVDADAAVTIDLASGKVSVETRADAPRLSTHLGQNRRWSLATAPASGRLKRPPPALTERW